MRKVNKFGVICEILDSISLSEIEAARRVIATSAIRTPLIRLNVLSAPAEIYLKLENLQPIGSFKIRGRPSPLRSLPELQPKLNTQSPGSMASARKPCFRKCSNAPVR